MFNFVVSSVPADSIVLCRVICSYSDDQVRVPGACQVHLWSLSILKNTDLTEIDRVDLILHGVYPKPQQ